MVRIRYFSGTGNARAVAGWVAASVVRSGRPAEVIAIEKTKKENALAKDEMLCVFYPTHGFNAPPIVLKYLARIPNAKGNKVVLINTRAGLKLWKIFMPGLSGIALFLPALILLLKGYRIQAMRSIDLPSNWISIHPGVRKKIVESMFGFYQKKTERITNKILAGKKLFRAFWFLPLDLAIGPISIGYYLVGRFLLAKTYFATDRCTKCMRCIHECPVKAISLKNNRPYWGFSCESCMRCMNNCPEKAIQTPHGQVIPLWILIFTLPAMGLAWLQKKGMVPGADQWNDWLELAYNAVWIGLCFLTVWISYHILHFLVGIKPIERIFRWTSFTWLPFWRRYKAPPHWFPYFSQKKASADHSSGETNAGDAGKAHDSGEPTGDLR
jgi:Pyruvate/2-oxoacid:ferredoxin oxidoreductase delta subunit